MVVEELGTTPVSQGNPAGENVRFEPEFEEIEAEIAKLNSPTAGNVVDWDRVVNLSSSILADKSKDILVACYLTVGMMKSEGLDGLSQGVHVIRTMIDTFWDSMYPPKKRMRGRLSAFEWWMEKVDADIALFEQVKWLADKRNGFIGDLRAIDEFLTDKSDDAPILRPLIEKLANCIIEDIPPEPLVNESEEEESAQQAATGDELSSERIGEQKEQTTPKPVKTPPQQQPPPSPREAIDDTPGGDADKLLKQGIDIFARTAGLYVRNSDFTPLTFRLGRIAAWIQVVTVPPATDGKTLIPPPDEQLVSTLENLYSSGNWRELLVSAESRVMQYLFWFDIHRYVAEALDQLRYPDASQAVARETAAFIDRLPGIERMAFDDGTPFAGYETLEWLTSISHNDTGRTESSIAGDGISQEIAAAVEESQNLLKENKTGQALKHIRDMMAGASSRRNRFLWGIALCRILLRAKQARLCTPYFEEILRMLDTYRIEEWEPRVALDGLVVVLTGLKLQDAETCDNGLMESVLNRISALDPGRAMELI